ncbi:WecB/TagA/CpsF family glycosyltransferase [Neobacillus kokaensis]|uniref:N-acetylglucosaminyldiphosphoundecaprenol N-acetyl-beta-D-mannosaminyltransferase n=1 Tax=Neobacillus kokaensis TaxID=2759023 RepID=A0ABQ3N049_9BACI|nr:WecB/TagA/CpsF family glycosyltransferase [Neobacillus kokaensis]GHH97461.1 acetylglucosaminyldiphosphoundecaprenol acetyl-beta-D-mannosaminyltransferase [Neobacillus kokaensis]
MKNTVNVLGIEFINKNFNEVIEILKNNIQSNKKSFVVTANPEIAMFAYEHPDYNAIVQLADMVVPDGIGIVMASKILNTPIQERVAGFDLTVRLLELGNEHKWRIYLLGGKEETNKKAVANIASRYPQLQIVGSHHGYFDWKEGIVTEEIQAAKPDIVFVALGYPRQEEWIVENLPRFSKGLFMGVGGSIDVLAGEVKRAPQFFRRLNLEWFYRLLKQPTRWRRMLALPQFLVQIFKIKLSDKTN